MPPVPAVREGSGRAGGTAILRRGRSGSRPEVYFTKYPYFQVMGRSHSQPDSRALRSQFGVIRVAFAVAQGLLFKVFFKG